MLPSASCEIPFQTELAVLGVLHETRRLSFFLESDDILRHDVRAVTDL